MKKVVKKPTKKEKLITLKLTQKQAEELNIVFCECGHWLSQHFSHDKMPCAHCRCVKYKQTIRLPEVYTG